MKKQPAATNRGGRTPDEWAKIEAEEHDDYYENAFPFNLREYQFTVKHALWYEDYAYKKGRRRDRGHRTKKFLELVDLDSLSGKNVLDIGCGIGQYSVLCAKMGALVTGVELSSKGVEIADRIAAANGVSEKCTFIEGEFNKQVFPEEHFDVVMLHEVLHHAIKYPRLKENIARVTKSGGKIVIADTVRGAGIIHLGRKLVKYFRYRGRSECREHEENLGDVLLSLDTYEELGKGFSYHRIYPMSFLYMIKQTNLQYHVDWFIVRLFLRMAKYADDVLLTLFPFLKNQCGEAILYIEK